MKYNPARRDNFVLGGVFCRVFPLLGKTDKPVHIWDWKPEEEKQTLQEIYNFFNESWRLLEGKTDQNPDLILLGTSLGIQNQGRKNTGKNVWDLYEAQQYGAIKERTAEEVEDIIRIASRITKICRNIK